ncbi:glutamate receptor ionotropic, NMDA 1-like isoform X3 [Tubulanus polymorphus]|uniref:glutamate receptor ionotropic, NMDA 1-like isoform X3 n=1 Tax=Tubulanus polymorphus TaxID=672921 RepID=UPI003DA53254
MGRMCHCAAVITVVCCLVSIVTSKVRIINIGGVLSSRAHEIKFQQVVSDLNRDPETQLNDAVYNATTQIMHQNPIRSAMEICETLLPKKVYSVVVSHPPKNKYTPPISVSYTCGFYKIPVIGISARDSVFSDTNLHRSYLRTVPPYSHQAKVWVDMVRHFRWSTVVIFHSADQEGRAMVATFQNEIGYKEGLIAKVIDYAPGEESYIDQLRPRFTDDTQVFLLSASKEDATVFFKDVVALNMSDPGYVWILSEQALEAENAPSGALGLMLRNSRNEDFHIQDSVKIIGKAFKKAFAHSNMTEVEPPSECSATSNWDRQGTMLYHYLVTSELDKGLTGKVKFNDAGDRLLPVYDIINVQGRKRVKVGKFGATHLLTKRSVVNEPDDAELNAWNINTSMTDPTFIETGSLLSIDNSRILWPGNQTTKPEGYRMSMHLRVVTIHSIPFVFARKVESEEDCDVDDEIYCPWPNSTEPDNETPYCCKGYCMSMLKEIAASENFTYDVHLVADGQYGSYEVRNGSSGKQWNGMIAEILNNQADLIIAPLTIDPDRALVVEFTKPFKYQGLTILVKKQEKNSSLGSFLQPFQDTLWILVGLSVHVVALVLYLLDRFSPFGRFKLAKNSDTEEDALNLSSAMWFAWGVLLNSGIGEGTPRSFSARVLGMVWAGFAMIIVASYTANLAAFLVLDRPEASITGIDDARLRNPQKDFTYGSVRGSSVLAYFKHRVELSTMYRTMEEFNSNTPEEAIQKVKKKKLNAFIWDSTRLEYEASKDCDLVTVGELFGRSGFGIGLRRKSPWVNRISLKILNMHERGSMEKLDTKWILVEPTSQECKEGDQSPATLGLTNMAGVFMLVAGGIIAGVFLIFIEIAYKRHRGMKEKELELARNAADRWRGNIEVRKCRRSTFSQIREELSQYRKYHYPKSDRPQHSNPRPQHSNPWQKQKPLRNGRPYDALSLRTPLIPIRT